MFKANEVERKIEINLLTDMQINLRLELQTIFFLLSLQRLS